MTLARTVQAALTVGLAVSTLGACSSESEYADSRRTFDGGRGVPGTVIDLPDGDRFSAGLPDGHQIVVQRYDDGADYWTEELLDDDYSPDHSMGAVCVDATCTRAVESPSGTPAGVALTADGDYATFGRGGRRLLAWAGGTTWTRHELEDLGRRADVASGGRCDPLIDNSDDEDVDEVGVWVESLSGTITFARKDGEWSPVAPPATYDTVVDTGGRTTMSPVFDDGERHLAGLFSPDTREIWAQTRWEHEKQSSKARLVLTVPDGLACREGRIERPDRDTLYARLDCFEDDRVEGTPDTTLALLSYNAWAWQGGLVKDAGRVAGGGLGIVFAGAPGMILDEDSGELEPMTLPFPEPQRDPLELSTDWLVRVAPRLEGGRCLATVWSADSPGAESWQEGPSFSDPAYRSGCPELDTDRTYGHRPKVTTTTTDPDDPWDANVQLVDGRWHVVRR
jgi:hypothetical protein